MYITIWYLRSKYIVSIVPQLADEILAISVEISGVDGNQIVGGLATLSFASGQQEELLAVVALEMHEIGRVHALVHAAFVPRDATLHG